MDSENKCEPQAAECFMCKQVGREGCLECRTQRLLRDIRTSLYEKMGEGHNRSEWEERALAAESKLSEARSLNSALKEQLDETRDLLAGAREELRLVSEQRDGVVRAARIAVLTLPHIEGRGAFSLLQGLRAALPHPEEPKP